MPAGKRKSSVIREFSGAEDARQSSTSTLRNGRGKEQEKNPLSIRERGNFPGEEDDGRLKSFGRGKMPGKALRYWSGSLLVGLFGILAASASAGNSIMDIVNVEMVEKLIAERRENASREDHDRRFVLHNGLDEEDAPDDDGFEGLPDEGAVEQQERKHRNRNKFVGRHEKGRPHRHNLTGLPDYGTILADLAGPKVLKSVGEAPLITKKEYLKKDWCKTEPMVQKIREDGCLTRSVLNRFCYGQCNSFYVPKTPPRRRKNWKRPAGEEESEDSLSFRSCGFCKPKRASWTVVTLRCPHIIPRFKKRKVRMIKQCKCIAENVSV